MIELEGRMLTGLDEFMLRLGHLKVLCGVAVNTGSSWFRINREVAKVLTRPVPIPPESVEPVAEYLRRKRLCPFVRVGKEDEWEKQSGKFRYPELVVESDDDGLHIKSENEPFEIWWQDACLASPRVVSRVGAITISAKAGSKTGLSHISDWAHFVGLIGRAGEVSAIGRLIARLGLSYVEEARHSNPYVIGFERIALAFAIIGADIDCFSRFAPMLLRADPPIRKAEGSRLFANTVQEIAREAREGRYLTVGRKNKLYENLRDLENAARRRNRDLGSTSTAWHRASSRLESYVDLGLLEKGRGGDDERFEYVYYPTTALQHAVETLDDVGNARKWLEEHLASALFAKECSGTSLDEDTLLAHLPTIASSLARPTGPLPIDAIAIGLAWVRAENDDAISISAVRQALEQLARARPRLARLSRGGIGDRAEFISLDVRKLEELTT